MKSMTYECDGCHGSVSLTFTSTSVVPQVPFTWEEWAGNLFCPPCSIKVSHAVWKELRRGIPKESK